MSERLCILICFVLVLGISSAGWADAVDVNNPSFELGADGNRVPGHVGYDEVMAWKENADNADGFVGVDVQCPYASSAHCHRWPGPTETGSGTDVVYSFLAQSGSNAYQVLDANTSGDANAVIAAGRRYTLTFDAILEDPADDGNPIKGSLFYPDDVNYPDADHKELASETYAVLWTERDLGDCAGESDLDPSDQCPDWNYDLTVKYVAEAGSEGIGKTLGVKLTAPTLAQEAYMFVDNVRLDWSYATIAYDPNPADGAELITKNPTLAWKPGVWADQHEVYFGTDETAVANADNTDTTDIYIDTRDPCSYTPSGPLVLGETYYWKITEVNSGYSGPAAGPPWEGDVWSFRVEGHAYDPSPADGEMDVVFLGLDIEWSAGTEAENHVVYLGTDETTVANATTSSDEYETTLGVGTESHPVSGQLTAGVTYYWRIDEKSAGGSHIITGDVWSFTAGTFLVVDDFESYTTQTDLWNVWDDYWVNSSDGEMFLENDVNIIRESGSQVARLKFTNSTTTGGPKYTGSEFDVQDMTEVDIGSNWTIGGVKAMQLWMRGDPCNVQVLPMDDANIPLLEAARPWIELEDTSSNTWYVLYPEDDMADVLDDSWHQWDVDLAIFDACGVTLTAIDRFTIGIGGNERADQRDAMTGVGSLWVEDIRLYPPRCFPEYAREVGNFNEDCIVDGHDLAIMGRDWLTRGGWFEPTMPDVNAIIEYKFDEGSGSTVTNTGTYGSDYNLTIGQNLDPNGLLYMEPNNDPCWVDDPCRGWTLWFDGELGLFPRESEEVELGGDYLIIPPLNLTTDTITITAWIKPDPFWDAEEEEWVQKESFTGIVTSRHHDSINPSSTAAAGLNYGGGSSFSYDGMLCYTWNDNAADTWNWDSGIDISDWQWNFVAVTVEPEKGTVYKVDESKVIQSSTNAISHSVETIDGRVLIAGDIGHARFFRGQVDDVRIYDQTLTIADIMGLAGVEGIVYVPCGSPADLVIGIQDPNDPNQPIDDQVDFLDYAMFADNWLEEFLWPF